jgi:hypothetical protein
MNNEFKYTPKQLRDMGRAISVLYIETNLRFPPQDELNILRADHDHPLFPFEISSYEEQMGSRLMKETLHNALERIDVEKHEAAIKALESKKIEIITDFVKTNLNSFKSLMTQLSKLEPV